MTSQQTTCDPPATQRELPVLRCTTTADFLAALPQLMGFVATESLCVVFFSGKRAGPTMRMDLPESDDPRDITPFIDAVCDIVRRTRARYGVDAPAVVISCAETFAESDGIPRRRLARRLARRLEREGMRARELCCIAPDGWASYLDQTTPRRGRPLTEIAASPVASSSEVPTLENLGSFATPDTHELETLMRLLPSISAQDVSTSVERDAEVAAALVCEDEPTLEDLAHLMTMVDREAGWFTAIEQLTATGAALYATAPFDPASPPEAGERLRAASRRLVRAVELCPEGLRPSMISICAFTWWLRGLQSVAARQIAVALELDPDHERANIISRLIDDGACPPMTQAA